MTAPWMPPLPEPDLPSTPIYYATSPITSRGPGPMYPPMWGADQMRRAQADAARAALEHHARVMRNELVSATTDQTIRDAAAWFATWLEIKAKEIT